MKPLHTTLCVVLLAVPLLAADPTPSENADLAFLAEPSAPDCEVLTPEELANWLPETGVVTPDASPKQLPICPTPATCPSGCGTALSCTVTVLGTCCAVPGGGQQCCAAGTFKVHTCPCTGGGGCAAFNAVRMTCP
jgi:hypothetical protein